MLPTQFYENTRALQHREKNPNPAAIREKAPRFTAGKEGNRSASGEITRAFQPREKEPQSGLDPLKIAQRFSAGKLGREMSKSHRDERMHSFSSSLYHCVFATKNRQPWLTPEIRDRLWPYLGGIARDNGMKTLAIGGVSDHVHLLVSLPATLPLSKAIQLLKGNSSKWIHETFPALRAFAWQQGYAAFSIGVSGTQETSAYIRNQEQHHRTRTYREEVILFLQRHGLPFGDAMLE